ncbi:MAG: SusC/RagA family TonB-linked outer membrane protein [Dysgonamonadaceae bacterium]|jgi:TonB-linked SusC/RagA family outer membrane protein|nr:SusC/RagA family TonB-linked outer membrane protein [Dysgonamonadaceae bacterium]
MKQHGLKNMVMHRMCLVLLIFGSAIPLCSQEFENEEKKQSKQEEIIGLNGNQNKDRITGAYSQMCFSEVENNPITNNIHKITGQLSGLFIFQSNGEPGVEAARVLLRGQRTFRSNSPVILVDGFERDMALLDPNEIETITLLKDAAATAQYGLRGGNGIIAVTTKRGSNSKVKVSFSANAGIKEDISRPQFLNSYDYARLYNEAMYNDYNDGTRTSSDLAAFVPKYSAAVMEKYNKAIAGIYDTEADRYLYPNINWYDSYIKKNTWQQHYNLSARGGGNFAKYFLSLGYTQNEGIFNIDKEANTYNTNADMNIVTLRANVDIQATKRLTVTANISARQEQRTTPGDISSFTSRVFQSTYRTPPNAFSVLNPDGSIGGTKDYTDNPYGLLNKQGYSLYYVRNTDADITFKQQLDFITSGLKLEATFAFDTWFDQETKRNKAFAVYNILNSIAEDGTLTPQYDSDGNYQYEKTGSETAMGSGGNYPSTKRTLAGRFKLDYQRDFGKNSVYVMFGGSRREVDSENNSNLPRQYAGLNSRISYTFDNRYLLEFNGGYEGSEQFYSDSRFGFFPAISAGWILTNETFFPKNDIFNFLKIRGSYGLVGNDDVGGYFTYLHRFYRNGSTQFGKELPVSTSVSFGIWEESAPPQYGVTWEKVRKSNIGIDALLLNEKIELSADVFYEKNKDIMVDGNFSLLLGSKLSLVPIGKTENKGLDLSTSFKDKTGEVNYRITGVFSTFRDKIIEDGKVPLINYQSEIGLPINNVMGLEAIGFYTQATIDDPNTPSQSLYGNVRPGDIMYKDQNRDGIIDEYDRVFLDRQMNHTQVSMEFELYYKGFDFGIQIVGQYGGTMSLNNESTYEFYMNGGVMVHHLNRYNPRTPETYVSHGMKFYKGDYPRLSLVNAENNRQGSSFWRLPTDLLRLKTIEVGYSINPGVLSKIGLEGLRLYANGYNLAHWSHTNIIDVETGSGSGIVYPIQRIWNFGIKITL